MASEHRLCHPVQATFGDRVPCLRVSTEELSMAWSALAVIYDMRKIQQSFGLTCCDTSRHGQKKHG
jgi:hypothetical protein